jgi:hypothetical protein
LPVSIIRSASTAVAASSCQRNGRPNPQNSSVAATTETAAIAAASRCLPLKVPSGIAARLVVVFFAASGLRTPGF